MPIQAKPKQWTYPQGLKLWTYPQGLKFPCPIANHKHEMTACAEYFAYSPVERWAKIDRARICYCCLKPKSLCQPRRCSNEATVPEVLKCSVCAEWAATKGLAPFSIFYCKRREHGQTRAPISDIKASLEKYLGKLGTTIVDTSIIYAVNFMHQIRSLEPITANAVGRVHEINLEIPAPTIDSETGKRVKCNKNQIIPESKEHSF